MNKLLEITNVHELKYTIYYYITLCCVDNNDEKMSF